MKIRPDEDRDLRRGSSESFSALSDSDRMNGIRKIRLEKVEMKGAMIYKA